MVVKIQKICLTQIQYIKFVVSHFKIQFFYCIWTLTLFLASSKLLYEMINVGDKNSIAKIEENDYASNIQPDGSTKAWKTWTRFYLIGLTLFCLSSIWSNILAFNFAIICLQQPDDNSTTEDDGETGITFSPSERTLFTSAVAFSALIANFVVVHLITKFGVRCVFTGCGILSAIVTALMPWGIQQGFYSILFLRFLQGLAFAGNFPVIGAVASRWIYYKQNGLCVSSLVAYVQLSPTLSMPISGALCESSFGWTSVFYGHSFISFVLFISFFFLYRNNPEKHPFVSRTESRKISIGKPTASQKKEHKKIPYLKILKTPSVWAVWIASVGNFVAVNTIFLFSPIYFYKVLEMPVASSGISSAIPAFLQFALKIICGFVSDKFQCINETNRLRFFNSIAFFGAAFFFAILTFLPIQWPTLCLMCLGTATGLLGVATGGFFKNGPIISLQYSQFVTGNVSLGLTITMLIVPFIKNGFAPNDTFKEWNNVFLFIVFSLIVTNIFYILFCSAKPAEWTKNSESKNMPHSNKVAPILLDVSKCIETSG